MVAAAEAVAAAAAAASGRGGRVTRQDGLDVGSWPEEGEREKVKERVERETACLPCDDQLLAARRDTTSDWRIDATLLTHAKGWRASVERWEPGTPGVAARESGGGRKGKREGKGGTWGGSLVWGWPLLFWPSSDITCNLQRLF